MNNIEIIQQLWAKLWLQYSQRVEYCRIYEAMVKEAGGISYNDHIAFRSLRLKLNRPGATLDLGIAYIADLVEALGYRVAGEYEFPDKFLYARHYLHPDRARYDLPKLFISELIVDALPEEIQRGIFDTVSDGNFYNLQSIDLTQPSSIAEIFSRPWQPPYTSIVEATNTVSQYGAWVLLHGYAVNHFTADINRQQTTPYRDIETTARALAAKGVPMKDKIEGSLANGLRQTATQAVREMVEVRSDRTGEKTYIPWTYAYYELAERHSIELTPGNRQLFEGFLAAQAQNLFEITTTTNEL
jgi:hypothetical protein